MRYLFISPHLDDVALSVGGIVNHLAKNNVDTQIWTFFSGSPKGSNLSDFALSLHNRWKLTLDAPKIRRLEDRRACRILGAAYMHFNLPDCIYRRDRRGNPIVQEEVDLYQPIPTSQQYLVNKIYTDILSSSLPEDIIVSPMAIGNHIDHRIIVAAIKQISNRTILYYEDYPYIIKSQDSQFDFSQLTPIKFALSEANVIIWHAAIAEYQSQISTFWKNKNSMKQEIIAFADRGGGMNLWKLL